MASKIEDIVNDAIRQGWRKTAGGSHWKLWAPGNRGMKIVPYNYNDSGGSHKFEADMRKLGWRPQKEVKAEQKAQEIKVTTVQDLIKTNGQGEPITAPAVPPAKEKRISRAGLEIEILKVLKGSFPSEVDFTTLKMKVSLNSPGVTQSTLHNYIGKLKVAGKVLNTRMGYYRAASADVALDSALEVAAPKTPVQPVLPGEAKLVIDNLMTAVAEAEKLIVRLSRQIAENSEAAEMIKRMAAKL